jgi:RNA polymerase sigma factor (sigma-70 family)
MITARQSDEWPNSRGRSSHHWCVTTDAESPKLEELLRRAPWARRLAHHLVHRREDAEDLLQDAWLVARDKGTPDQPASRPWLTGVLRVLSLNRARAAGRRRQREAAAERWAEGSRPDDLLTQVETQRRLSEALLALAEPYRTTLVLRYYEDLSAAEIARRTQAPAGTVRWRLKEGLARLRRQLDQRGDDREALAVALARFAEQPARRAPPRIAAAVGLTALASGVVVLLAPGLAGPGRPTPQTAIDLPIPHREAPPAPGKDSEMNKTMAVLAAATSLVTRSAPVPAAALPASKVPRFQVPLGVAPIRGPVTAKVTLLAFMDYQSPFCLQATGTIEALLAAHPGQLRYQVIARPLPFHHQAAYATRAAFAAGQQGRFWEMHTLLLEHQRDLEPRAIEGYASKLGLDLARFRADLIGPTVTNQADLEEANARSVNITAVPSFFLNGRLIAGAQPREVFERALAEEIAYADAVLGAGVASADLYTTIVKQGAAQLSGPPLPEGEGGGETGVDTAAFQATHKLLADNVALVNACFESGRVARPGLAGRVVVDVRLARGDRPRVLLHDSTLKFPRVDNCVVQSLSKLSYPQLETGGPVVARRPFSVPPAPAAESAVR